MILQKKPKLVTSNMQLTKSEKKRQKERAKADLNRLRKAEADSLKKNKALLEDFNKKAAPDSVSRSIRYEKMYDNGICQIDATTFSYALQVTDINYTMADRSEQKRFVAGYSEFLNSFDPSVHLQVLMKNRFIDKERFEISSLVPLKDEGTEEAEKYNSFISEYNTVLLKMAETNGNGLVRYKYFIISTKADNYEDAFEKLDRVADDMIKIMRNIGCVCVKMNGMDRLLMLNESMNPDDKLYFDYEYLLYSGKTTKDYIAPYYFDWSDTKKYEFGDYFGQVLVLKDYGPDATDSFLKDIQELPFNLDISMHDEQMESQDAHALINGKLDFMNQQKSGEITKLVNKGLSESLLPDYLNTFIRDASGMKANMDENGQKLFKKCILFYTYAKTGEELAAQVEKIKVVGRKKNMKITELAFVQEDAMNSVLGLGTNYIRVLRTLPTINTAMYIPFLAQDMYEVGGTYYGINSETKNLIFFDINKLKNQNSFVLGKPGSGKSFITKKTIIAYLLSTEDDIIIIDPEREYGGLVEAMGGQQIYFGKDEGEPTYINPFDFNTAYSDSKNPLSFKISFLISLMSMMIGDQDNNLTRRETAIIDKVARITYKDYFKDPSRYPIPLLSDFVKNLRAYSDLNAGTASGEDALNMAESLEPYVNGSLGDFSSYTNVDIKNRLVNFDINDVDENMQSIVSFIIFDQIWNRITHNRLLGKKTHIFIDEAHMYFASKESAFFLQKAFRRARKYNAAFCAITQNITELLLSPVAKTMISNSEFVVLMDQSESDREEIAKLKNLTEEQKKKITYAEEGHGLLCCSGTIIPFEDNFPSNTTLYKLMTTKPEEINSFKKEKMENVG